MRGVILQIPYSEVRSLSLDSRSAALLRISLHTGAAVLLWCDAAELLAREVAGEGKVKAGENQAEDGVMFSCNISVGSYVLHPAVVTVSSLHVVVHTSDILVKYPVAEILEICDLGHPCVIDLRCISKRLVLEFAKSEDANKCRTLLFGHILLKTLKMDANSQIKRFYIAPVAQASILWAGGVFNNLE